MVLKKHEEDQWNQSCKIRSITLSQGGKEYSSYNKKTEGLLDLPHLA